MNVATDLETILERATSGRQLDKTRVFKPSWFYSIIEDPFGIWCEYHAAAKDRVEETTLFDEHRMQLGNEWEINWSFATNRRISGIYSTASAHTNSAHAQS